MSEKSRKNLVRFKRGIPLYLMALPGLIYLFINNYMPMFGLVTAFKDIDYRKGIWGSDWVGFENFEYLFKTKDAWNITRNTILYNLAFIVVNTFLAVMLAIFLSEITKKFFARFFQSVILLPHLISIVVIAYLAYAFLSPTTGLINKSIIEPLGGEAVAWYTEAQYWPFILIFISAWKGVGYTCVIYYASIVGIDKSLYEAAELDGATKWQQVWRITIPQILPTITMMTLLHIGKIFYSDFGLFLQVPMSSGPLLDVTSTIDTYVYRGLLQLGDVGMSAAAGFYQSIIGFILVLVSNWLVRRKNPESSLF